MAAKPKKSSNASDAEAMVAVLAQETSHHLRISEASWYQGQELVKGMWLGLTASTIEAAAEVVGRNIKKDLFTAFEVLGGSWFSHHQAIRTVVQIGRYGDALALCRMLLETGDLITYFSLYPDDVEIWWKELGVPPALADKDYRASIRRFGARAIRNKLEEAGTPSISEEWNATLNTAVHASPWGAQYYGRRVRETTNAYLIQLAPTFDPVMGFAIGQLSQNTLPGPVEVFLRACEEPESLYARPISDGDKTF